MSIETSNIKLNILLLEDDQTNITDFEEFCTEFEDEYENVNLEYSICKTEAEAYQLLQEKHFNAAIIDLNINNDTDAGIRIVDKIHDSYRIPMIVFSGNASRTETKKYVLKSITKGAETYEYILKELYNFNRTGIMKILGKTGQLENLIDQVFWKNLHPKMPKLQEYANDTDIEKDLLRYIISHFNEVLEEGVQFFFPEEMYICPPINQEIRTGSIIKEKSSGKYFIVMSPACDIQQGCDKFVLANILEIDSLQEVTDKYAKIRDAENELERYTTVTPTEEINKKTTKQLEGNVKSAKKNVISKIESFIKSPANRYHYISANNNFGNSIIDFREIKTIHRTLVNVNFSKVMSITPPFLKDIQSRFSSYYARQGSPDFDTSKIMSKYESELL